MNPNTERVVCILEGRHGAIDGYWELVIGTLLAAGVLVRHDTKRTPLPNGGVRLTVNLDLLPPPLGHLGESDFSPGSDSVGG